jgi:hypothetical protein
MSDAQSDSRAVLAYRVSLSVDDYRTEKCGVRSKLLDRFFMVDSETNPSDALLDAFDYFAEIADDFNEFADQYYAPSETHADYAKALMRLKAINACKAGVPVRIKIDMSPTGQHRHAVFHLIVAELQDAPTVRDMLAGVIQPASV